MPITPTQTTPLPDPPSRADPENFAAKGDAFLGALPQFQTEQNQQAVDTFSNVNETFTNAQAAESSKIQAGTFANNSATSASQALASQNAAKTSETNAKTSELAAADFANAAQQTTLGFDTNRPRIRPSLNLDFVNQQVIDRRIVVDRATPKSYFGKRRVLVDENLLKYSEDFTSRVAQQGWASAGGINVTVDNQTSPNGELTADTITADGTNNVHRVEQESLVSSVSYLSFYVKANTNNFAQINLSNGDYYANFDLVNGIAGDVGLAILEAGIEPSTNGFFRIWIKHDYFVLHRVRLVLVTGATSTYNESNTLTTSIILWGAMLETAKPNQTSPSAYVPNLTAYPLRNYSNALEYAGNNEMPIEFDPITQECLGIKPESQQTNLLLQSQDFDNAVWAKNNSIIYPNIAVAPDGTSTADLLYENTALVNHTLVQNFNVVSGTTYLFSIYAKQFDSRELKLQFPASIGQARSVVFDFLAKDFAIPDAQAGFEEVGNGWFRIWIYQTATVTGATNAQVVLREQDLSANDNYQGNGYSGLLLWGAQLEASTLGVPSSYIKTTIASVTRLADKLTMPVSSFDFKQGEGTLYAEVNNQIANDDGVGHTIVRLTSDATNYIEITLSNSGSRFNAFVGGVRNNGTFEASVAGANLNGEINITRRVVLSFTNNNVFLAYNGLPPISDTAVILPTSLTTLLIGQDGNRFSESYIRTLRYYPKALTALEAQALSQI